MKRIYLDHNATTRLDPRVAAVMEPLLRDFLGNPSSPHAEGRRARRIVEDARESVARFLGVEPRGVVFTSGATEANNLAVRGAFPGAEALRRGVAVTAVEHPSVLRSAEFLRESGAPVRVMGVDPAGRLLPEALEAALAEEPALVCVMAANNEVGTLQPVAAVAAGAAARGIRWHVDAVQMAGRLPLAMPPFPLGSLAISGHKIGGPKGVGALAADPGAPPSPLILGGSQERDRRAGTENVPAIAGFGEACRLAAEETGARGARLRDLEAAFLGALRERGADFRVHGPSCPREKLPGTLSIRLPGVRGEVLIMGLDLAGVAVSLGNACSSGAVLPSHVLSAMGVNKVESLETIRVSFGVRQTEEEAVDAASRIAAFVRAQVAV